MLVRPPADRFRRTLLLPLAAALLAASAVLPAGSAVEGRALPGRLSDQAFWRLVTDVSEDGGTFPSDNLVSNEIAFQAVLPRLSALVEPGGVYIGVGPEQNYTYIAALAPAMAFIVDIRRQNLLQHLLYKALMEMSPAREDFLARLFGRPDPARASPAAGPADLFAALSDRATDEAYVRRTLDDVVGRLTKRHRFALSEVDLQVIERIYGTFVESGPDIAYAPVLLRSPVLPGGLNTLSLFPTYAELMTATDGSGRQWSYLATAAGYGRVRQMHIRNLIVPVIGDFAGDRALRDVGRFVRDRGGRVTTFYTSNVEQYLFQNGAWQDFYDNVSRMPVAESGTFVRAYFESTRIQAMRLPPRGGPSGPPLQHVRRLPSETLLSPIGGLVDAVRAGEVTSYADVVAFSN